MLNIHVNGSVYVWVQGGTEPALHCRYRECYRYFKMRTNTAFQSPSKRFNLKFPQVLNFNQECRKLFQEPFDAYLVYLLQLVSEVNPKKLDLEKQIEPFAPSFERENTVRWTLWVSSDVRRLFEHQMSRIFDVHTHNGFVLFLLGYRNYLASIGKLPAFVPARRITLEASLPSIIKAAMYDEDAILSTGSDTVHNRSISVPEPTNEIHPDYKKVVIEKPGWSTSHAYSSAVVPRVPPKGIPGIETFDRVAHGRSRTDFRHAASPSCKRPYEPYFNPANILTKKGKN